MNHIHEVSLKSIKTEAEFIKREINYSHFVIQHSVFVSASKTPLLILFRVLLVKRWKILIEGITVYWDFSC